MKRGEKRKLVSRRFFNMPVVVTLKRSSDGEWEYNGEHVPWFCFRPSKRVGKARVLWLRIGEYVLMLGYGNPSEFAG